MTYPPNDFYEEERKRIKDYAKNFLKRHKEPYKLKLIDLIPGLGIPVYIFRKLCDTNRVCHQRMAVKVFNIFIRDTF